MKKYFLSKFCPIYACPPHHHHHHEEEARGAKSTSARCQARRIKAKQGEARRSKAKQGEARRSKAQQGEARRSIVTSQVPQLT